jgi:bla regulator protein blaR1
MLTELINHLWQSTLFVAVAALLAFAFRRNRAHLRYCLWFGASFKFFVPFSLLSSVGRYFDGLGVVHTVAARMSSPALRFAMMPVSDGFSRPFRFSATDASVDWILVAFAGLWACGFVAVAFMRLDGYRRIRSVMRSGTLVELPGLQTRVAVRSSSGVLEPGVVGIFRPVLLLPANLVEYLTSAQLRAVLAHELCHIRRRDNLFASIHMLVESIFWFHPLVWWIGARMVEERERACDEAVLLLTGEPRSYAEGILNVCKLYAESPLSCMPGITGANVRRRIETIMANRIGQRLNFTKRVLLASAGVAVLALPVIIGMDNAPAITIRAQSPKDRVVVTRIEVAPIQPSDPGSCSESPIIDSHDDRYDMRCIKAC